MHKQLLDHYYIELLDGSLAVVAGNWHTPFCVVSYVKYRPTNTNSIWFRKPYSYERLVKVYDPRIVYEHTSWTTFIPFFGSSVPCIPVSLISKIYDPISRALNLYQKASDPLERIALDLVHTISSSTGVLPGVTGSILVQIHNVNFSDIDIVVYGSRSCADVVEFISSNKSVFQPLRNSAMEAWIKRASQSTELPKSEVLKFYRNWRRGVFAGREYSIAYSDGVYRDLHLLPSYSALGYVKAVVELRGDLTGLNYPPVGLVERYKVIESRGTVSYDISYVMSYESLYTPGFYEGGLFEVSGILQCSDMDETCRILVGVHEYKGYMMWLS